MNIVFVEMDRCIACKSCEQVCRLHQSALKKGGIPRIFVNVDMDRRQISAGTCLQCENAPCMQVCPVSALFRDAGTAAVVIDRQTCIGCGMCVLACPYGHMHFDGTLHRAAKCDLCGGAPKCVQVCMARALHFGDIREFLARKQLPCRLRLGVRALPENGDATAGGDAGDG